MSQISLRNCQTGLGLHKHEEVNQDKKNFILSASVI